jgi:hypothetical protein
MPAVILLVAGGLAVLGLREQADQRVEVEQFAAAITGDIAAGRDPAVHFVHSDPLVTAEVLESLEQLLEGEPFEVVVGEGDLLGGRTPPSSSRQTEVELLQPATHTVAFERDGRVLLTLRIDHQGSPNRIAIIGFRRPPAEEEE